MTDQRTLSEELQRQGIVIPEDQTARIQDYCMLLWDWNLRINLTRHADFETFVARDIVDSVQLADCLEKGESVMDVGSGGGVPGILIAILRPDIRLSLCEATGKKADVLRDIVDRLDLRCHVIGARVQDALEENAYNTLTARAVGSLAKMLRWVQPNWQRFERLLLIKGPRWVDERKEARHLGLLRSIELRRLRSYQMPGTESESVILSLKKSPNTTV